MKFNKRWLDEWIPNQLSSGRLSDMLTMAGLEVDSVTPCCGEFSKVVTAEVLECRPHPDSDHMFVTLVNAGGAEALQIVCGAANCRAGLRVCCALEGAQVGKLKIKKARLRGVDSCGMLCSYRELGMSEESSGIIELPKDAPVGVDVHEYLHLDDCVIDIELTTNRSDCMGICGIARETAVLLGQKLKYPEVKSVEPQIQDIFPVELADPVSCPRYIGRVVRGVNQKAQSPLWMVERLRRCGMRSVSPIVDVTNYVMLEYSQPLHSFDLGRLRDKIVVRQSRAGEKLTVLSGEELTLKEGTLLITDGEGPCALAGIFGGLRTGINENTTDVFLESAFFSPDAIKGRARAYGLDTDASRRYERGVDHDNQRRAVERATQLLLEIGGGKAGPVHEVESPEHLPAHAPITLRQSKLEKVLGEQISPDEVFRILSNLELSPVKVAGGFTAVSPGFRFDIAIEEDLIEEIGRIYGYDNIPNAVAVSDLAMVPHREEEVSDHAFRQVLASCGYNEAITYSFTDPKVLEVFNDLSPIMLTTPISPELSAMRTTLLAGLVTAVRYNQHRQQQRVRLFELGMRYIQDQGAENGVRQEPMIAAVAAGTQDPENWGLKARSVDFFDLKGAVEELLALTARAGEFFFRKSTEKALHPGRSADIYLHDRKVGCVGMLHPLALKALDLRSAVGVFEIERAALGQRVVPVYRSLSKFPSVRRDFAFVLSKSVPVSELCALIGREGGELVRDVHIFDVFDDASLGDKRSVAVGVVMQNLDRTLEDNEVDALAYKIVQAAATELKAVLRA